MDIDKTSLIDVLSCLQAELISPKKPLRFVFPCLGTKSLQTRTKQQKSLQGVLNCCELHVIFKSQNETLP